MNGKHVAHFTPSTFIHCFPPLSFLPSLTHSLSPWSRVFLWKLIDFPLPRNSTQCLELSNSLPIWQSPTIFLFPKPDWSNNTSNSFFFVLKNSFNIILPSVRHPRCVFFSCFPTKLYMHLSSPPFMPWVPPYHSAWQFTLMMFGEQCRSRSITPCNLIHFPVRSTYFLSTLFSNTTTLRFSLMWKTRFHIHVKQHAELQSCIFWSSYFVDSKLEGKIFCLELYQAFLDFNLLLIYSWIFTNTV